MKYANAIVVGGPIAVGKSTLVASLPYHSAQELVSNDELQQLMLRKMYEGDQTASQVFQLDMMLLRFARYQALANRELLTVFDRAIFEDLFFASLLLVPTHQAMFNFYHELWSAKVEALIAQVGAPRLYVLLTCSWPVFRERIFKRERAAEIDNFSRNELYFKKLVEGYESFMKGVFRRYALPHLIINTDQLSSVQVLAIVQDELVARQIAVELKND